MPLKGIGFCKGCKGKPQRLANSKSIKFKAAPESTNAMTENDDNEQINDTDNRNLGCTVLMTSFNAPHDPVCLGSCCLALAAPEGFTSLDFTDLRKNEGLQEVKDTLHSLKTLDQVFGQTSMLILPTGDQLDILDGLMCSIPAVLQSLSALEHKAKQTYNEGISGFPTPLTTCHSPGIKRYRAKESQHLKQSDQIRTQKTAPQSLSVFVGTWNMGGSTPPRSLSSWLSARKIEGNLDSASVCVSYDLYMIGTQENPQGDREWAEFLRTTLISQTMNQYKL
ncbi:unnamed protein product, partial [Ranitomeya imitator]